ncbi:Uncharacterised protein [Mycobacteroides abscessus subsp. abscessus]|nr:Uncharacterised protein [Mycobacteroides abscessus subsp. abscessus]
MVAPSPCVRTTLAPSPTRTSVRVLSGPISASSPITVLPSNCTPGRSTASLPMRTPASTQVEAGSMMVTPARMWRSRM